MLRLVERKYDGIKSHNYDSLLLYVVIGMRCQDGFGRHLKREVDLKRSSGSSVRGGVEVDIPATIHQVQPQSFLFTLSPSCPSSSQSQNLHPMLLMHYH